jgi:ORF6N domain-containing protein
MVARTSAVDTEEILRKILDFRGQRVLLDSELATLYRVQTKALNRAVRRNIERFPADFMFQLSTEESALLRSQIGVLKSGRGAHRKYTPYVFTERGVAMLSSVLGSERAVQVNIEVMRAFVSLRHLVSTHKDLAAKLTSLEKKYDRQFKVVFDAIRGLMHGPETKRCGIGFTAKIDGWALASRVLITHCLPCVPGHARCNSTRKTAQ